MSLYGDMMNRYHVGVSDYDPHYTAYDIAQVSAIHRNWVRFQETYPHNAALLRILFGGSAKEVHMEVKVIPEEKARVVVQLLRERPKEAETRRVDNLLPMGDS